MLVGLSLFGFSLSGQAYHELSIGVKGNHLFEVNPPELILQDLDYLFGPQLGYQLYLPDNRFSVLAEAAWFRESGLKEYSSSLVGSDNEYRETSRRNSISFDLELGWNLAEFDNSFLQLTAGARAQKVYFFSQEVERTDRDDIDPRYIEFTRWKNLNYSLVSSFSYQFFLSEKASLKEQSLALRFAADFVYSFPIYRSLGRVENEFATLATGLTVSLVWRIRGKKNRGLF